MKRAVPHRRGLFLLAGVLLVLAGIAWGAAFRPHSNTRHATAFSAARAQSVSPKSAVAVGASRAMPAPSAVHETHVAGEAGMRIYRDPQTGEIGPPTADMVVEAGSREDASDLQQVIRPDGSAMINLQGRFQESMVIRLDANGKRVVSCVTDPKAALQQPPSQAPQREDR